MKAFPKIWITGKNGQLGKSLLHTCKDVNDVQILATDKSECDITSHEAVASIISAFDPDYIINGAAYTAVDKAEMEELKCYEVNAYALKNLSNCSPRAKIIHLSSDYVYHSIKDRPLLEDDIKNPQSVYAKSKLLGEEILASGSTPFIILRTSWVYSEFGNNFVSTMLKLQSKPSLSIVNDQIGCPTYAIDIASIIVDLITRDHDHALPLNAWNTIYNYANEGVTNWFDFAKAIFRISGKKSPELLPIPTVQYPTPATRPLWSILSMEKIKKIGIIPNKWEDSLEKCMLELIN